MDASRLFMQSGRGFFWGEASIKGNQITSGPGPRRQVLILRALTIRSFLHPAGIRRAKIFSKGTREPLGLVQV